MPRKSKAEKRKEVEEIFEQVDYLLNMINNDNTVPRNIRKMSQDSIDAISCLDDEDNSPAICASNCVSMLEDIGQDLNCPIHTRTQIYQILALLEQVRDSVSMTTIVDINGITVDRDERIEIDEPVEVQVTLTPQQIQQIATNPTSVQPIEAYAIETD